jgi:hypothetical protein
MEADNYGWYMSRVENCEKKALPFTSMNTDEGMTRRLSYNRQAVFLTRRACCFRID